MTRFETAESEWTAEQATFAQKLRGSARGKIGVPFLNLLPQPALAEKVADVGAWLRFEGTLPADIRELVTLATAAHWRSPYEWTGHARLGLAAGLEREALRTLAEGGTPDLPPDQALALAAARAILASGSLDDARFVALAGRFGREGAIELVTLCGYYSLLAMVIGTGYAEGEAPDWGDTVARSLAAEA
ncbi:4-carboxymuconolactone decarboxylase [Devosia enhydra]|uniref:4-carboxymuconolactone decarboxylase n=1 Tax=Devosia enhydra TaxID=665118 RepID=A0A1K2HY75_9HYPH|nr:carboxymuconolactone decarboxylase family protein [Devosia enhydra]SFZ84846.1 4-carboxymuconolactone decarboxylase [Devosia enhydra]